MTADSTQYYLGLDIGTDSVGFAAATQDYELLRYGKKDIYGIRLFDEGKTAEERRSFRCANRRGERRKARLQLLQELFAEEICQTDRAFFVRLQDSKYLREDKLTKTKDSLFHDASFKDVDYHKTYPTIYHLRKALIESDGKFDIRLIYLAAAHVLKNRGHFLFEGENFDNVSSFSYAFNNLKQAMYDEFEIDFVCTDIAMAEEILKSAKIGKTIKKNKLKELFQVVSKQQIAVVQLLCGSKAKLSELFNDEALADADIKEANFANGAFDEKEMSLTDILGDRMVVLRQIKSLYDWAILAEIRKSYRYISFSKVAEYEKHKMDLNLLKMMVKKYCPDKYVEAFMRIDMKANYVAYSGMAKKSGKKLVLEYRCNQEEVCKYFAGLFAKIDVAGEVDLALIEDLKNKNFLPKQISKDNATIPYQLHLEELHIILEKASRYYPFLRHVDDTKLSVMDKVMKILTFRIPYYVGPINSSHQQEDWTKGKNWIVKKSTERVRPWNFEEVVDLETTAERFIRRMTNKCTYLLGADVIPKDSLLYGEFMVFNELNNLKVFSEKLSPDIKNKLFNELFKKQKKVTKAKLLNFLIAENIITKEESKQEDCIAGIDGDFKTGLTAYHAFKDILDVEHNEALVEAIIVSIVLFGDDKQLLLRRLQDKFSKEVSKEQIKRILTIKLSGWGTLSKELLTETYGMSKSSKTGELHSIIFMLRTTNDNLMQLLSEHTYTFSEEIKRLNASLQCTATELTYDAVDALYVSPKVKRAIWQTLQIVREIKKVTQHDPMKVFVEMARGEEEKKRTISRKEKLVALYKNCKDDTRNWLAELEAKDESYFRSDRMYLYYTQMGKCMYSGRDIDLKYLFDANIYDVDHIYPQSKTKDDSLENRVLVLKDENAKKGDRFPIIAEIRSKQHGFWSMLYSKEYISKKKYERLTRSTDFSEGELADFIARQLVETRQSSKAVAEILTKAFPKSEIVYVKAKNVSDFRQKFDFVKVRDVNDYHHAHDAYLNIVVGNTYHMKFTNNPLRFIQSNVTYNLKRVFDYDVKSGDACAWRKGEDGTIATVNKTLRKNTILFTRYAFTQKGAFSDLQLVKKGLGQVPIKPSDKRLAGQTAQEMIDKYGGYNSVAGAYFVFVEHEQKKKLVRSFEFVPIHLVGWIQNDEANLSAYLTDNLLLKNPRILLKKVKINTLFEIDGFRMHLSGRSTTNLKFKCANQLIVSDKLLRYIKKLVKFVERLRMAERFKKTLAVNSFDDLNSEQNIVLYDEYLRKLENSLYNKKLGTVASQLREKREVFLMLSVERQAVLLVNALQIFKCNSVNADLSLLGEAKYAARIHLSKNINHNSDIKIIYQSPTGLFEQVIKLNDL